MALSYILLLVAVSSFASASQQNSITISPALLSGGDVGACPSSDSLDSLRQTVREEITTALQYITSHGISNCPCGGSGQWTNIADFNFSDPDVACPSGFTLHTPARGCGRAPNEGPLCKSVVFSSGGQSYSRTCVWKSECLYQKGAPDAFYRFGTVRTLEENYVDGVSLTHGAPSSRQHIWTFAAAFSETRRPYPPELYFRMLCLTYQRVWPSFLTLTASICSNIQNISLNWIYGHL